MKKRLCKSMPHVPLLKLRPELENQEEADDDPDDPATAQDTAAHNAPTNEGANASVVEEYSTFQDIEQLVGATN